MTNKAAKLHEMVECLVEDFNGGAEKKAFDFATENGIEMGEYWDGNDMKGYWVKDDIFLFPEFR